MEDLQLQIKSKPDYLRYCLAITVLVVVLLTGYLFGKKSKFETDKNLQTETSAQPNREPAEVSGESPNPDLVSNIYEQIGEAPTDLKFQKNFTCYLEYELKNLELSAFETKILERDFSNSDRELGIFCNREDKVLISYSDASGTGLIFYEPFTGLAGEEIIEQYLLQSAVGTANLKDSKLISWDDQRLLFAAKDSSTFGGLREQTMLVYLLNIDSLDFSDPELKIIEICKFEVSPGTSMRSYNSCITPKSRKQSAYLPVDKLW